jgi:bifunctional UDP-N-acetylglucosamine pyrophosphorylase/glucosamine-1-phosphate N-acetyltransferase
MVGAGSVITDDVPVDALGISRSRQERRDGWAGRFRMRKRAELAVRAGKVYACVTAP